LHCGCWLLILRNRFLPLLFFLLRLGGPTHSAHPTRWLLLFFPGLLFSVFLDIFVGDYLFGLWFGFGFEELFVDSEFGVDMEDGFVIAVDLLDQFGTAIL
jgi:hypothetical protein